MVKDPKHRLAFLVCCLIALAAVLPAAGQKKDPPSGPAATPAAAVKPEEKVSGKAFRGVVIGMLADELRKKLGSPRDAGETLDFYVFSDDESAQVVYDKTRAVSAISIDFTGKSAAPAAKDVLGVDVEVSPDGSMYKMIRYPKSGYWISYNRTPGTAGMVSITMQKIP